MDISKIGRRRPPLRGLRSRRAALDPDKARAACAAYRDVIDRQMQKNWNANSWRSAATRPGLLVPRGNRRARQLQGQEDPRVQQQMRDFLGGSAARPSAWLSPKSCRR